MNTIVKVVPEGNMKLNIRFSDGFTADLDVKPFIKGGISEKLLDPTVFDRVFIDEFGGISWPNGFDFCPNFLRMYLKERNPSLQAQ